jgi:hypothetical protein
MTYVDKAALLACDIDAEDLDVPGLGLVRVKGLTRAETVETMAFEGAAWERAIIVRGLVEPRLTDEEVLNFQNNKRSGVVTTIFNQIVHLSGVERGAAKSDSAENGGRRKSS